LLSQKFDDVNGTTPCEQPDIKIGSRSRGGFQDRQAQLSSWRGQKSPQRRRIDLCKPTTTSKISIAKMGVTIDFLINALPHWVSGIMGRPFQSPFAKPPGQGLSSSTVNVPWGFLNVVVGYVLIFRVGSFDLRSTEHVAAAGLGAFLTGMILARMFGRFNGGSSPSAS
jgi:hypothetical protein